MNFKEGQLVIYVGFDDMMIGKIKRITGNKAFVYYHEGDTAALTDFSLLRPINNEYCIEELIKKSPHTVQS